MWSTREELEAVLAQAGLGEWCLRLAAAARLAMILQPGPLEEGADAPIGACRLGGMPDLPAEMPWPWRPALSDRIWKEHAPRPWPLSFVAQIDFAEVLAAGGLQGFPSSGRLLFFCDPILWPWGTRGASVVFITDEMARLGRRDFPVEFSNPGCGPVRPRDFMFRPRRLTPKLRLLPPPLGSRELLGLDGVPPPQGWSENRRPTCWGEQEWAAYEQFWKEHHLDTFDTIHQVGGIAFAWEEPVEADCVKFADDDYPNHPTYKAFHERMEKEGAPIDWPDYEAARQAWSVFNARERATHLARADSWQLVLQIDSDIDVGMQWGDLGRIYVCIRKTDLAERRFDRCWTMWQSS